MAEKDSIVVKALGLNTQPNEVSVPEGSLTVAENMEITRDNVAQLSPGFEDFSTNLPDYVPQQLLSFAGTTYLNLDDGLWYYDTSASQWLRKRGSIGGGVNGPTYATVSSGHLYFTSAAHVVIDINLTTGQRSILAGRYGASGSSDGTGDAARFNLPVGIASDGTNLYVCDAANHTIRTIVIATGAVTTLAGTAGASGSTDATGAAARFNGPNGIVFATPDLFIADGSNFTVRRCTTAGVVTTIAGTALASGTTDATGAAARFNTVRGMASLGTSLYVVDGGNQTVRRLAPPLTAGAAIVTTIAGTAAATGTADGTGAAARFNTPHGMTSDGTNLLLCDFTNASIRKLAPPLTAGAAIVTTPVGLSGTSGSADGIGAAARFNNPKGIAADSGSIFYVCDTTNNVIRKVYPNLYVSTIDGRVDTIGGVAGATAGLPLANGIVQGPS